ncbi:MAG TPA: helix-turn-helix transcriptional regulator [Chlamydiales bacterium]|jgi:transcriptional regulator with XRE-family HTH domain
MKYSIQEVAASIKAARKKKGLSQKALGDKVGMPQSHISKIEQGLVDLQTSSLIEIARALELEPMLVSREYVSAVQALQMPEKALKSVPAYQLSEGEENDGP